MATGHRTVCAGLRHDARVELILLAGRVRRGGGCMTGAADRGGPGQLYADRMFPGTSGILPDRRVLTERETHVSVEQALPASARQVVLPATARKLPGGGTRRVEGSGDVTEAGDVCD